jgi:hypothetical protein
MAVASGLSNRHCSRAGRATGTCDVTSKHRRNAAVSAKAMRFDIGTASPPAKVDGAGLLRPRLGLARLVQSRGQPFGSPVVDATCVTTSPSSNGTRWPGGCAIRTVRISPSSM